MEAKPSSRTIYQFGEFRLDADRLMLYRGGNEIELPPKAVETLLALAERRGEIVSKDELMTAIWSDAIVEESNLSRYIHVLRSTLGEQADGKPFIETFRRRGYRFNAEVSLLNSSTALTVEPLVELPGPNPRSDANGEGLSGNVIDVADWQRGHPVKEEIERSDLSFERFVVRRQAKLHLRNFLISVGAALFFLISASLAIYFVTRPPLTDKDVILVADFDNRTGDEIFDGTLKQGLSIQLQQSPFLSLFPDERVRHSLELMRRGVEERISREVAAEICQRHGLKAYVVGSIYQLGEKYFVALEVINAETSEVVASAQQEADGKERVLKALALAAAEIRQNLGESLAAIQRPDVLPWEVTTSSLDALKMLTQARKEARSGNWSQAINFTIKATEIDPEFSMAYRFLAQYYANNLQPSMAMTAANQAYGLRDRASERERLQIDQVYYRFATGEWEKAIEAAEMTKKLYPRDYLSYGMSAEINYSSGRYEKAVEEARAGIEKGAIVPYSTYVNSSRAMGRFEEARAVADQGFEDGYDEFWSRKVLPELAFLKGDDAEFENELKVIENRPYGYWADAYRGYRLLYFGKVGESSRLFDRAQRDAVQRNALGSAGIFLADVALYLAFVSKCEKAGHLSGTPLSHALCRDFKSARSSLNETSESRPSATLFNSLNKPLVEAAIEYRSGNAAGAIDLLTSIASNFESASAFQVQYLSGQAYLKLHKGQDAARAFQKILDHRGEAPFSVLYPLAYLGLARAQVQTGDIESARQSFKRFLEIWKDADSDLLPLIEARREYSRLG